MLMFVLNAIAPGHQIFARILHVSPKSYRASKWPLTAEHAGPQGSRGRQAAHQVLQPCRHHALYGSKVRVSHTRSRMCDSQYNFFPKIRTSQLTSKNVYEGRNPIITVPHFTALRLTATCCKTLNRRNMSYSMSLIRLYPSLTQVFCIVTGIHH